jgi:hypothetical protein
MIRTSWLAPLRRSLVAWLVLASLAVPAAAQQRSSTEIAASYLSPHTVAGVRIDLDRVDLNMLRRKAQALEIIDREEDRQIGQGIVMAQGTIGGLIATGAEDLWILVDPRNPNEGVMAVLTVVAGPDAADNADALAKTIEPFLQGEFRGMQIRAGQDHVAIGPRALLDAAAKPSGRTFPEALLADRGQVVTAFAVPSDDHRRAALETVPRLPGPFAGIDLAPLFRDGRTARADLKLAPQLSLEITVDAASTDGAVSIASIMNRLAQTAAEMPEMATQPEFGKLVGSLKWKSEGNAATFSMIEGRRSSSR